MIPRKPFWPPTLSVKPVHLQASDTYAEALCARGFRRLAPDAYGVAHMDYDEGALARGDLVIRRLDVVFPSGLEAWLDEDLPPLEANVATRLHELSSSVLVYLGVPRLVLDGPNMSKDDARARSTRYVGDLEAKIPWMRPKLEVLFQGDALDRYEVLPIGRIEQVGYSYRFSDGVWPIVSHARACAPLVAEIGRVLAALEQRRHELVAARKEQPFHLTTSISAPGLNLFVLVNRHLAALQVLSKRHASRPYDIYRRLRTLYLALVAFGHEWERPPAYEHDKLADVMPWLSTRIVRLLDAVGRDQLTRLSFERGDYADMFSLSFRREDLVGKRPVLVATCDDDAFLERLPRVMKMAAPFALQECMRLALRGVRLELDVDPPPQLPQGPRIASYRIWERERATGREPDLRPYWQDILACRTVSVYVPGAPPSLKLFLYGIDREIW
ncbi:type VI secretion system baseplate subunit TssK [Pendulispora rubella]|uniref:Type VI secretion system baseplate subunit TssK n=1 Tax=Pendulispora rubella TaxID=2741070 RepID=A0ABZ2LBX7_9BACT